MMEHGDLVFAQALERWILDAQSGRYQSFLSAQDMHEVMRTKGMINAYDEVLREMREIAKKMNEESVRRDEARYTYTRPN